ncbi:putative redox protein [Chitinophaga jiangningensis]|uniref:Putative redox protein n=1 Tax=Chitinophaga jiangningensis TaxID=1419482 RepID=A0A1M7MR14_9BACT|nr:OsmC family protein [Chitinophaga jiangningensis]SHM93461.1 putative redox protein [Chitinophaga jiangningensis]
MKIALQRIDDGFNMEAVDENGHKVLMDSSVENGGKNNGVRPMQMIIMGLGGCSAIDIVMILKKQRQEITDFRIEVEADREKGKEPSLWENAHLVFHLSGNIDADKAARAVELSMNKYCSVAETLRKGGTRLTWEVKLNA